MSEKNELTGHAILHLPQKLFQFTTCYCRCIQHAHAFEMIVNFLKTLKCCGHHTIHV